MCLLKVNIKSIALFSNDYKTWSAVDAQLIKYTLMKIYVYCNSSAGSFVLYIYIYSAYLNIKYKSCKNVKTIDVQLLSPIW